MNPKLKQQVLSEWTEGRLGEIERPSPADLRSVFQKAFGRIGLANQFQETTLAENWHELVGPALADHCHPRGVRKGVLYIVVDHPAWLHQIVLAHKTDILQAAQKSFPHLKIKDINLRIG